jgi:hypothetical protein
VTATKQTAITKHPAGHGSYCVRLKFKDGATMEVVSAPLTIDLLVTSMEDSLAMLRRIKDSAAPLSDAVEALGPR